MTWNNRYISPKAELWQGPSHTPDASYFFQIVQMLDFNNNLSPIITQLSFAVIGFCCDEGIRRNQGRVGAASGPDTIRQALAVMPVQKKDFHFFDAGNIICTDRDLEASQQALARAVNQLLLRGIIPIVLGGGHELAWGHYLGITMAFPKRNLGIVNFDAYFDMRPELPHHQGTSESAFLQIAEAHEANQRRFDYNCIGVQRAANISQTFQTMKKYHTKVIWADELHQNQYDQCIDFIDRIIDENDMVYVSICMDVFAASIAPGVNAQQVLGVMPWEIIPLIRQLAVSGKVISYDIAEMTPAYDSENLTAKLSAHLVYEVIHHHKMHIY